jgi:hypothetical protein
MKSLESAKNNIAGLIELPGKKNNKDLEQQLRNIESDPLIDLWEQTQNESSESKKNTIFIQIKKMIHSNIKKLKHFVVDLYILPTQNMDLIFTTFMKDLVKQGDNFNWAFEDEIQFDNPDQVRIAILDYKLFTEKLSTLIFEFEDLPAFEQRKIIESTKDSIRSGILWIVDAPNQHFFNVQNAKQYIEKNIRVNSESIEQVCYVPEAYVDSQDKYHSVYKKFTSVGFQPMIDPRKDKTTDIDAFLINEVTNKLKLKKYRVLIIGGGDKSLVNFAKQMLDTHKGIIIYFFLQDNYQISINKMKETFGSEVPENMIRYFCDHHMKLNATHIQGKLKLDDDYLQRLAKSGVILSYSEDGLFKKYYIHKKDFENPKYEDLSKMNKGYYIVKCRVEGKTNVKVVDMQPIDR